ncbi:MAG: hypothetical protein HGB11_04910, partial [Chlorobiales bacterium]|nr:hypothetical protein [Chlorobiales bacterium]
KSNDFLNPVSGKTDALSLYNSDLAFDYAATDNITVSVSTTMLQNDFPRNTDSPKADWFNELRFGVKVGSLETLDGALQIGGLFTTAIPINRLTNRPFVRFGSGTLDLSFLAIGSYYFDNLLPEESIAVHANLGAGYYFSGTNNATRTASSVVKKIPNDMTSLRYGLGVTVPIEDANVRLFGEFSGEAFLSRALPTYIYSRENYAYIGVGARWEPADWFGLEGLGEFLVMGGKSDDETVYDVTIGADKLSKSGINYAPWKISGGIRFNFGKSFTLFSDFDDIDSTLSTEEKARNKKIRKILDKQSLKLVRIYEDAREADETLEGSVYFDLVIGKDGSTKNAKILVSTFNETRGGVYLEKEMLNEVKKWKYPAGSKDLQIEILRLHFAPKNVTIAEEK